MRPLRSGNSHEELLKLTIIKWALVEAGTMYDDLGAKFKIELNKQFTEMAAANRKEQKPTPKPTELTTTQKVAVNVISFFLIFGIMIPLVAAFAVASWGLLVWAFKFFFGY